MISVTFSQWPRLTFTSMQQNKPPFLSYIRLMASSCALPVWLIAITLQICWTHPNSALAFTVASVSFCFLGNESHKEKFITKLIKLIIILKKLFSWCIEMHGLCNHYLMLRAHFFSAFVLIFLSWFSFLSKPVCLQSGPCFIF